MEEIINSRDTTSCTVLKHGIRTICRFEIMVYHLIQEHNTAAVKFDKLTLKNLDVKQSVTWRVRGDRNAVQGVSAQNCDASLFVLQCSQLWCWMLVKPECCQNLPHCSHERFTLQLTVLFAAQQERCSVMDWNFFNGILVIYVCGNLIFSHHR